MSAGASTVREVLTRGVRELIARSDSPELDAELLLSSALGVGRSALIVRGDEPVADTALSAYRQLIEQRKGGMPVAYLTGQREFWSLPLKVTPAVLVPRHETEILVETALGHLPKDEERTVLDLGTGSGAVALAIACERPRVHVIAVDISPGALGVARDNARALALANVTFRLGSWFDATPGQRFDMIVANPPYVAEGDAALSSLCAEPRLALLAGPRGLDALETIVARAPSHLNAGGWLMLEHGSSQHREVAHLLEQRGFSDVECHHDYSGLPRVTRGTHQSLHEEST